jgi:hypothetical protein
MQYFEKKQKGRLYTIYTVNNEEGETVSPDGSVLENCRFGLD